MPDTDEFDEFDDGNSESSESDQFKAMRKRANQANKFERENADLKARLAALERKDAFTSAGLALTDKQQAALLAAHGDAELSADALKATAIELGFAKAEQSESDDDARRSEAARQQAVIGNAQAGATPTEAAPNIDQQIVAAQNAGDWGNATRLQAAKLLSSFGA